MRRPNRSFAQTAKTIATNRGICKKLALHNQRVVVAAACRGAKPQGVADAGSMNDYGWLFVGKVTFSSASQQKSLRDPFLARPLVVLVGLPRSAKPHLSKLRCGSASLTQDDAPTFTHCSIESGDMYKFTPHKKQVMGAATRRRQLAAFFIFFFIFD